MSRDANDKFKCWFMSLVISSLLMSLLSYGIFLCIEAFEDMHSVEVDLINSSIRSWENSYDSFTNLTVWVSAPNNASIYLQSNSVSDWPLDNDEILTYSHYKYSTKSSSFLNNFSKNMTYITSSDVTHIQSMDYSLTSHFFLYIETPQGNITESKVSSVLLFSRIQHSLNMNCITSIDSV